MFEWVIVLVLLVGLIAYIVIDYKTKGLDRKAIRVLSVENEWLQHYVDEHITKRQPDTVFVATFQTGGMDSIESSLHQMIIKAQSEILIVSPWIKMYAWQRISGRVSKFCKNGGKLRVFMNGIKEDFDKGYSDWSVVKDIRSVGGVVTYVPRVHAKLCVIDRREALITSANLTLGGFDSNYEAGVLTSNPTILKAVCSFIEKLTAA